MLSDADERGGGCFSTLYNKAPLWSGEIPKAWGTCTFVWQFSHSGSWTSPLDEKPRGRFD